MIIPKIVIRTVSRDYTSLGIIVSIINVVSSIETVCNTETERIIKISKRLKIYTLLFTGLCFIVAV